MKKRTLFYYRDGRPIQDEPSRRAPEIWAIQFEKNQRLCSTRYKWGGWLSTVYIGLDHNVSGIGPPLIFETMLFPYRGASVHVECWRYSTEKEAIQNHSELVRRFKNGYKNKMEK